MGFPGQGLDAALSRLKRRPRNGFVGANVGANKDSTDRAADYVVCGGALAPYADYLVCNVSSPNTPGLRNLQGRAQLADLLKRVQDAIAAKPVPLVVKIAPDATEDDLDDIVACRELKSAASSSATRRCHGPVAAVGEAAGSRRPVRHAIAQLATEVRAAPPGRRAPVPSRLRRDRLSADAYAKIRAGAAGSTLFDAGL
jgi:dihydroorotate dehydrogenase